MKNGQIQDPANAAALSDAPLYWMALGTFAIGTEGFMIAAILPSIASSLAVSLQAVGGLIVIFTLAYAISSPVLTALTGTFNRRQLLIASMAVFGFANLVAAASTDYWHLAAARVLLAFSAGLFVPNASALAGALAAPEKRGRALAIVNGGLSVAVALGVPLGAFVGARFGWRMTFVGVAILALVAVAGLVAGIPQGIGSGLPTTTLRKRLAVLQQPAALAALLITTLWGLGGYSVYTYISPFLGQVIGFTGSRVGMVLFLWGTAAFLGLVFGGKASDRLGNERVIGTVLPVMALALASLSIAAYQLSPARALLPVLVIVFIWGASAWSFFPSQQSRLIGVAGQAGAPVILSLNASFMYLGFSLGAALGSLVIGRCSVADLGWVGALCVTSGYVLFLATTRRAPAAAEEKILLGRA
jgi:predicted MFS family arabinose efflux permease